jgi:hypothetical protein
LPNHQLEQLLKLTQYWSTYTLDIYISIVWNSTVHAYGANAKVRYPTEVEDELITILATLPSPQARTCWLRGWNFTTDLYLTLEHVANRLRARDARIDDRLDVGAIFSTSSSSSATVLASITAHYAALPTHFKTFTSPTGDRERDIFGFQAANIQATMLLLRMLFLRADDQSHDPPDVQLKCNVAAELLAIFETIPTVYLRGISTPLIYHLAGIGQILGSVIESPLSEAGYQRLRGMLLSIADLLERLESGLSRTANISKGVRTQVERIDEYMRLQLRPVARPFVPSQPFHISSADTTDGQLALHHQYVDTVDASNHAGETQAVEIDGSGVDMAAQLADGWLQEFQLPNELLEDWPFPLNQQPDKWSFFGTGHT